LDDRQRAVAMRLSVFEYTFGVDDAVKVASDDELSRAFVEATVMELVDQSLLYWREDADRRALYRGLRALKQHPPTLLRRPLPAPPPECGRPWVRSRAGARDGAGAAQTARPRRESEWERLAELTPELVATIYELPSAEQAEAMKRMADALTKTVQFG